MSEKSRLLIQLEKHDDDGTATVAKCFYDTFKPKAATEDKDLIKRLWVASLSRTFLSTFIAKVTKEEMLRLIRCIWWYEDLELAVEQASSSPEYDTFRAIIIPPYDVLVKLAEAYDRRENWREPCINREAFRSIQKIAPHLVGNITFYSRVFASLRDRPSAIIQLMDPSTGQPTKTN